MTVKFITLGCKTNFYESEAMSELFRKSGFTITEKSEKADVYVINTCTVTGTGAQKSRQHIRRAKRENPDSIVAVTGCYAQTEAKKVKEIAGVDVVLGTKHRNKIVELVKEALNGKKIDVSVDIMHEKEFEELAITHGQSRIRANVKIQDGCNNFCSYCIIPYARGPVRSRNIEKIIEEVTVLGENNFGEIVLTGIHIGSYGKDLSSNIGLIDVVEKIHDIPGIQRIRLGSIEPVIITEDFVRRAKNLSKLCPQFHLSLQSGCDETLKRMNRHYTTSDFRNAVSLLRKNIKDVSITTDLMVGFVGETEEEFKQSYNFAKEIGFMQMHIFKYSIREGTKAASMPNQVSEEIKETRSHKMIKLAKDMKTAFYSKYLGKEAKVLVEQEAEKGIFHATTPNYMDVLVKSTVDIHSKFVDVIFEEIQEENLVAEIKL